MNQRTTKLVEKARQGNKAAIKSLVEGMRTRLHEYVNRLTLDPDLTDEIVQDSLITMMEQLHTLKHTDQLWPWLSKIALNRMRRIYRDRGIRKSNSQKSLQIRQASSDDHNVVADAITQELRQIVIGAMRQLKPDLRTVLVLRCYEQLSFPEIAERTGRSDFKARALFVRAKHALGKNLARNGFGKSSLLGALLLFGKMTASSEASLSSVSVSNAVLGAGFLPTLSVAVTTKMVVATVAAVGSVSVLGRTLMQDRAPSQRPALMAFVQATGQSGSQTHQHWYYYPPESEGTVHIQVRSGRDTRASSPILLQNEHANYSRTENTVLICNAHMSHRDGTVMRLPTDQPGLSGFLNKMDGRSVSSKRIKSDQAGLLVIKEGQKPWHVLTDFDLGDEACYRGQWPQHLSIIDQRDNIHKRGWTYVNISGTVRGQDIYAIGCVPLVSAQCQEHPPWIRLKVGRDLVLEDNGNEACIKSGQGRLLKRYRGGRFFSGMARPWQGLHVLDTVRRDAAGRHIPFKTNFNDETGRAVVRLDYGALQIAYRISMQDDLIEEISFSLPDGSEGKLRFDYPLSLNDIDRASVSVMRSSEDWPLSRVPDITWLVELAEGTLGQ
jgi:RNA polymerase sigma factor (sigma-70 family)